MHDSPITAGSTKGVGTVVFNRPERRNALSLELFGELADHLERWRNDDSVAVVVVTGGEEMFCSGLDLDIQSGFTPESRAAYAEVCLRVYGDLLDYPKPTIAACAGPTLGGGCDIAVFCDIRIGADNAVFGFPQVKFGLTPYSSPLWRVVGLSQAKLLTLSGERIDANEALRIGLIDRLVPAGTVVEAATAIACSIAETTTKSARFNKEMILRSSAMDPISALAFETMAYREIIWHPDVVERISVAYRSIRGRATERPIPTDRTVSR